MKVSCFSVKLAAKYETNVLSSSLAIAVETFLLIFSCINSSSFLSKQALMPPNIALRFLTALAAFLASNNFFRASI